MAEEKTDLLENDGNFHNAVKSLIRDAEQYNDDKLHGEREQALDYFNGAVKAKAPDGRSSFVMREVQDSIEAALPEILDVFESTDKIVEFVAHGPEDVPMARQATATVNYLYNSSDNGNNGFRLTHDLIKLGLITKVGVFKTFYDESEEVTHESFSGMTTQQVQILASDPEVEILDVDFTYDDPSLDAIDVEVKRTRMSGKYVVEVINPEDFIIHESAKTEDTAIIIGQRQRGHVTDAVEMGIDFDVALSRAGSRQDQAQAEERARRRHVSDSNDQEDPTFDPSLRDLVIYEVYVLYDADEDGIAERYRCILLGEQEPTLVMAEPWSGQPYDVASPFRTPGTVIGESLADRTIDIQDVSTSLMRATLDNAHRVGNPRTAAVQGMVNMDDLLDNKHGGVVRTDQVNVLQELTVPYVGHQLLPVNEYVERRKQQRTGMTNAGMGLDPDALQSSTEEAVKGTLGSSRRKVKLYAKQIAEGAFKGMAMRMLKLLIEFQNKPMLIRLNGEFVEVDPRTWHTEMDVQADVGLGTGDREEQLAVLNGIKQTQEQIFLSPIGLQNPWCTPVHYGNVLRKMTVLGGMRNPDEYWNPPKEIEQKFQEYRQQQAEAAGKPDPVEMAKIQQKQQEMQLRAEDAKQKNQITAQKAQADLMVKAKSNEDQAVLDQRKAENDAALARFKARKEIELKEWEAEQDAALQVREQNMEFALEKRNQDLGGQGGPSGNQNIRRAQ